MDGVMTSGTFLQMVDLLASDTTTFAIADADKKPHVVLFKDPLTPAPDLPYADVLAANATFDGYGATGIGCDSGTQTTATDPMTGEAILELKEPAGGFKWITTGTTNLPQTIYGYAIVNTDDGVLYFAKLFDSAITLSGSGQIIEIGNARIIFNPTGIH